MAFYPLKRPWTRKPNKITAASQFARQLGCTHLISAQRGNNIHDSITNDAHALSGSSISWVPSPYGLGVDMSSDFDEISFTNPIPIPTNSGDWHCAFYHFDVDSYLGNNSGFVRSGSVSNGNNFFIRSGTNNRPWIRWGGTDILNPSSGQTLDVGEHTLIFCVQNSGAYKVYIDGILEYSGTHAQNAATDSWYQYGWQSGGGERPDGRHFTIAFFDNEINDAVAKLMHDTRGGVLFEPRTLWLPVASGGGATISPSLIASDEQFYTHTVLPGQVDILPGLIASDEAFFTHTITGIVTITPNLVASNEAFYQPNVIPGTVTIVPNTLDTAENFFTHIVTEGTLYITDPGLIASAESFNDPTLVVGSVTLIPSIITSDEVFYTIIVDDGTGGPKILGTLALLGVGR